MALPVTITGISTAVAPVGPFKTTLTTTFSIVSVGTNDKIFGFSVGTALQAQSFTVPTGGTSVVSATLTLRKQGTPTDNVLVDIYLTDGAGKPIGASLGTSAPVDGSVFTTSLSGASVLFTFTTPVTVTAGVQYALVASRSGAANSSNYFSWQSAATNVDATEKTSTYNSSTATWSNPLNADLPLVVTIGTTSAYYFFARDGTTATTLQAYKAGVAGIIYSLSTARSSSSTIGHGASRRAGQTFTSGSIVASVAVYLATSGSPTDGVQVDIYATSGNVPTGASLGTSVAIPASSLTASAAQYTFTFTTPVTLPSSAKYVAVVSRTGAADNVNNYLMFRVSSSVDPAENGATDTSGTWSQITGDFDLVVMGAAGDVTTGWSSIATKTGFTTAILNIAGYQVGNVIHLLVQDGTLATSVATKYLSFDAATDTFLTTTETVVAASNIAGQATSGWGCSLVYRPTAGEVVAFYNTTATNTSGTPRSRLSYRRRTGVNTYQTAVQVDPNTATESTSPIAVLGASDRVHLLFFNGTNTMQRHLTSANVLGTSASTGATTAVQDVCRYDDSGTIRHVGYTAAQTIRWASADNPTVTAASMTTGTPVRATDDSGNPYALYQNSGDSDLYVKTSTDDGATFGSGTNVFTGTVAAAVANLSVNQTVYQRGSNYVIPYIVNDGGTLKYNEYTVRSTGPTGYTLTALTGAVALAGPSVKLAYGHAALVTAGAIAFSGQNVTLTKSGPTIVAQPGAFSLAGQSVTLRVDRRMPVTAGAIALAGQNVTLAYGHKLQAGTGSFALAGQSVTLRSAYKLRALTGALTIAEQSVRLVYARKGLALTGAIAFSGQNVTLIHTLAAVNYTLTALPGAFTLASSSVTLRYAHKLLVTTGTFALAGQPVTLRYGHKLLATVGTFALSGQNVTLFHARRLATLPTTVTLAGQNVTLRYAHKLQASAGAVTLDGQGVTLFYSEEGIVNHTMQPLTGTFALAGQTVGLRGATRMSVTAGAVTLSGQSVTLRYGHKTQAATGVLALAGQAVALRLVRRMAATAGVFTLSGKTVTLRYAQKLQATTGAFALTGTSVNLAYGAGQKLTVLPGGIVLSGKPIRLIQGYTIPVAPGAIVFNGKLTQYIWHRTLKAGTGAFELSRLSAGFDAPIAQPGVIRMGHARVYLKRW